MKNLHYIGKEISRIEGADKAAGKAVYIHDFQRPGMLYGKIKFSDHPHAKIKSIDTSRAKKLPGVKTVITAYNTPEIRIGFLRDNIVLKKDKVRQYRDEVAAVAAIDPEIAAEAVELIKVEYEPLPAVFDPMEAMDESAPLIHEFDPRGKPKKDNLLPINYHHNSGDIDAGKKCAKYFAEGEFSTQWIQQSCMGTAGCVAEFDMNSNCTIWTKTQIPFLAQRDFNDALSSMGLHNKNTRVIVPALGGGFGTGLDTHAFEYIAVLLAYNSGKPVKIVYKRDEEFSYLSPRQCAKTKIVQGCDQNGILTFRHIEILQDNGAYTSWGATYPTVMMIPATSLYRVKSVLFDTKIVYTNNTYCQAMRGYGNPEVNWALESNMDQLAENANIDPLDLRLINCNKPGETTPMGLKISTCGLKECLDSVTRKLQWKKNRNQNICRGVGIASLVHVAGGGRIYRSDGSGMIMKLDDFGNVNVYYGGVEMGQGLHTVITQSVSETLGVRPDKIFINETDTGTCPWDVGTHASRGAFMACNASILAAKKLREKIFIHAESLYSPLVTKNIKKLQKKNPDFHPSEFDIEKASKRDGFDLIDGFIFLNTAPAETYYRIDIASLLRAIHFRNQGEMLTEHVFYDPPSELPDFIKKGYGNMSATYSYGTQGVEVEVDTETGEVTILRMFATHDVGKVLNPTLLKGQMYGALAQGVGYALYEEIQSVKGKIMNPNFRDYKIPTIKDMDFPIDLEFIETNDEYGPYGAKGVGEPGLVPTAPAIANAIYNAVGIRIYDLPITPEKILKALQAKNELKEKDISNTLQDYTDPQ